MLRHSQIREDDTPEPEDDLLNLERAFANAVIVEGMKRDPTRAREVIAHVAHTFAEGPLLSGRSQRAGAAAPSPAAAAAPRSTTSERINPHSHAKTHRAFVQ